MNSTTILVEFNGMECKGSVMRNPLVDELTEKWFGKRYGDRVVFDLVEVAYLLSQGKIVVSTMNIQVNTLDELVRLHEKCFEKSFWPMLSVFKDLRDRGRRIRVIEPAVFLVKDKGNELRLIYVLEEKNPIKIKKLLEIASEARRNNLKVTLAIVSLQGELTYYELVEAVLGTG